MTVAPEAVVSVDDPPLVPHAATVVVVVVVGLVGTSGVQAPSASVAIAPAASADRSLILCPFQ